MLRRRGPRYAGPAVLRCDHDGDRKELLHRQGEGLLRRLQQRRVGVDHARPRAWRYGRPPHLAGGRRSALEPAHADEPADRGPSTHRRCRQHEPSDRPHGFGSRGRSDPQDQRLRRHGHDAVADMRGVRMPKVQRLSIGLSRHPVPAPGGGPHRRRRYVQDRDLVRVEHAAVALSRPSTPSMGPCMTFRKSRFGFICGPTLMILAACSDSASSPSAMGTGSGTAQGTSSGTDLAATGGSVASNSGGVASGAAGGSGQAGSTGAANTASGSAAATGGSASGGAAGSTGASGSSTGTVADGGTTNSDAGDNYPP